MDRQSSSASSGKTQSNAVSSGSVSDWLREGIRVGRFLPGQRLVESDLVEESGASRSKVREALQRLAVEGLITIEEFRGASVKRFSMMEMRHIYRARMVLEGLAAAEFADTGTQDMKARLQAIQNEMNQWEGTGNHENFAALNSAWHKLIIDGSGNQYVRQFLSTLAVPIYQLLFSTFYNAQRIDAANADHKIITAAIVEGRAKDAEIAMHAHIEQGLEALSQINAFYFR